MAQTSVVPSLVSSLINESFKSKLVYSIAFSDNIDQDIRNKGDSLSINSISSISTFTYNSGDTFSYENLDTNSKSLLIDFAQAFAFKWDDIVIAQSAPKGLIDSSTRDSGYKLAQDFDNYLANKLKAGTIVGDLGNDTTALSINSQNVIQTIALIYQKMTEAGVPTEGRYLIVPPWFYTKMVLAGVFNATENSSPLLNGFVSRFGGFDVFVSSAVPHSGGAFYKICAGVQSNGVKASQINKISVQELTGTFATGIKGLMLGGGLLLKPEGTAVATCTEAAEA